MTAVFCRTLAVGNPSLDQQTNTSKTSKRRRKRIDGLRCEAESLSEANTIAKAGGAGLNLRWTPNVRQPEPRLKVSPYRFRCRARSQ